MVPGHEIIDPRLNTLDPRGFNNSHYSVMNCVLCITDARRAEAKDRCYLYH